jgi:hypothetical protein
LPHTSKGFSFCYDTGGLFVKGFVCAQTGTVQNSMTADPNLEMPFQDYSDRQIWDAAWGESDVDYEHMTYPTLEQEPIPAFPGDAWPGPGQAQAGAEKVRAVLVEHLSALRTTEGQTLKVQQSMLC